MGDSNNIKLKKNQAGKLAKKIPYPIRKAINTLKVKMQNATTSSKAKFNADNLFWYDRVTNFGDLVGPYLFEKITGKQPVFKTPSNNNPETTTLAVGSIVNLTKRDTVIWGSGIMSRDTFFVKPVKTLAVRGPLTRNKFLELGYDCPEIYGDPALLVPQFYNPSIEKTHTIGIIPHHTDAKKAEKLYGNIEGIKVIKVNRQVETVLTDILSCESIVSSSLHGVIFGQAYKIPTAWIQFSYDLPGDDIKFYDYFASINLKVEKPFALLNDKTLKTEEISKIIKDFPQPKHPLINTDKLLEACPFNKTEL